MKNHYLRLLKISLYTILICLLTLVTQIGGVVLLTSLAAFRVIDKRLNNVWARITAKVSSFATLYLISVFVIVPLVAKPFGRVPLPLFETKNLKPANVWTCLLNRNYVRPQLKAVAYSVAQEMNIKFPGTTVTYLDANFPFINKFPLLPHLSHDDGRKLDLSFQYNDSKTGQMTDKIPSIIGYGICEEPKELEENKPEECDDKGYWQYNLLRNVVSQVNKERFTFDNKRTKELLAKLASQACIGKIFIEPHLKTRLGLRSSKIRFHGCQAVRHDDHIHVQLK